MTREPAPIAFVDGTYQQTLALLREARDYVAYQERRDKRELAPMDQLTASCEAMRMTARLTQVMAWLLVQKAVQAGEISREEAAAPEHRLSGHEVCRRTAPLGEAALPPRLLELLERSHALFTRIERLDALLDGDVH